jgi:hypothetical protein
VESEEAVMFKRLAATLTLGLALLPGVVLARDYERHHERHHRFSVYFGYGPRHYGYYDGWRYGRPYGFYDRWGYWHPYRY